MAIFTTGHVWLYQAIAVVSLGALGRFLIGLYNARRMIIKLKKQGLRMPPHHPIFGHLLVAKDILSQFPSDAHHLYLPVQIRRKYPEVGPVFYIDLWPFSDPFLVVASPSAAHQLIQEHPQPKADVVRTFMYPLTKNLDLVTMEGQQWKDWRNVYNPGFSAQHLNTLIPRILKEVATFSEVLGEHVKADDMFYLEKAAINLTMDVIGIVTLGTHFNAQRSENVFVSAIRNMIPWLPTGSELNPFLRWNLIRPFAQWYYTRQMDKYLSREIDNCFAINKLVENGNPSGRQNPETIIGLALDKYLEGKTLWETRTNYTAFKGFAMNQMKGLILAGHGTTANTVCYIFYMLSTHPSALQRIREEHESVFGADLSKTSSAITQNPHILNQLPYTIAVIKETLRLFPADASPRKGEIGFSLKEDGHQYPTNGCMVWSMPQAIHREPLYWPQPDTFLPERWLTSPDDPLHPVKGAWRAFEFGPRNCVGQGLSMLEMKLVLALTVRKFDIRATYQEWETKQNQSPKSVNGEKAYQVMDGTNRPRGGFPCRITMAAGVKPS